MALASTEGSCHRLCEARLKEGRASYRHTRLSRRGVLTVERVRTAFERLRRPTSSPPDHGIPSRAPPGKLPRRADGVESIRPGARQAAGSRH